MTALRAPLQQLLACLNLNLDAEDLVFWFKRQEILTSKFDFNENNVANNDIDDTWKTVKTSQSNLSITKSTTGDLILLMSAININLLLSTKIK